MLQILLSALHELNFSLIFTSTLCGWCHYYSHFTDEETRGINRLSDFLRIACWRMSVAKAVGVPTILPWVLSMQCTPQSQLPGPTAAQFVLCAGQARKARARTRAPPRVPQSEMNGIWCKMSQVPFPSGRITQSCMFDIGY